MWAHGAAFRDVKPPEFVDGCQRGDVIITANGINIFNAPLSEVGVALRSGLPLIVEVKQPLLCGPFYIHSASPAFLSELAGPAAAEAAQAVVPEVRRLFASRSHCKAPALKQNRAGVWAGDGGSTSRVHRDNDPQIEFCHVLNGVKLFTVDTDSSSSAAKPREGINKWEESVETSLPSDLPLSDEMAKWLSGSAVSVVAGGPGDVLCFWGGDVHCGTNAMASGPCIALFHG